MQTNRGIDIIDETVKRILTEQEIPYNDADWGIIAEKLSNNKASLKTVSTIDAAEPSSQSLTSFLSKYNIKPAHLLIAACIIGGIVFFFSERDSSEFTNEEENIPASESVAPSVATPPPTPNETPVTATPPNEEPLVKKDTIAIVKMSEKTNNPVKAATTSTVINSAKQPKENGLPKTTPKKKGKQAFQVDEMVEEIKNDVPTPTITYKKKAEAEIKENANTSTPTPPAQTNKQEEDIPVFKPQSFKEVPSGTE